MRIVDLLKRAQSLCNNEEDKHALFWLLMELLEYNNSDYLLNQNNVVDDTFTNKYLELVNSYLVDKIPVQQLVGHSYFYGRKFIVSKYTLIPRPETEELVFKSINYLKDRYSNLSELKVLDLATGSGCIGITLQKKLGCSVTISDVSIEALEIAKKNIKLHNACVEVRHSSWFDNVTDSYDLIISNPPYIPLSDKLENKVLKEPFEALFSGLEGLDSYEVILSEIKSHLNDYGMIAFEHGINQNDKLIKLINNNLSNIEVKQEKDLSGRDRFTFIFLSK